jgi:hypothetical protein
MQDDVDNAIPLFTDNLMEEDQKHQIDTSREADHNFGILSIAPSSGPEDFSGRTLRAETAAACFWNCAVAEVVALDSCAETEGALARASLTAVVALPEARPPSPMPLPCVSR